jgi:predicted transcriptional regulator
MARRREPQKALGRAIRERRDELGLSQEDLAHGADLHTTWVSHIESGRVNPALGTVQRMATALELRTSELLARAEALESR